MKACSSLIKICSVLVLVGSQSAVATVDNIPRSSIVCGAASQPLPGVDVSVYQAKANWTTVANNGTGFAFIKATEGISAPNTAFPKEWPQAGAAGLLRSAYHYFVPTDDPIKQANFFLNTVGTLADTDLPPMFDWEITNGLPAQTVVARAQQWLDYVEQQTGRTPIIYTNAGFFSQLGTNAGGNPAGFDHYPLYVSDYGVTCPKVPLPWTSWSFWQYSGSGSAVGIPGTTDLDVFNGVFNDLIIFITTAVPAGVTPPDPTGQSSQPTDGSDSTPQ
jgi:lysozyme